MNIVEKYEPREYACWSHDGGTVLCDKMTGAFLVLRFPEDLTRLRELLDTIEVKTPNVEVSGLAYKVGHRDARHAAAELALNADEKIKLMDDYRLEVERCFDIAQRLDAMNSGLPGAFTGTPSERIRRQIASMQPHAGFDA